MGRWSARACLPVWFSVLWLAAWVACSDRSGGSKSVEVRRIWEVYDESLLSVHPLPFGRVSVLLFWLVMFLLL